ncbi:MFS transporter [Aspergillus heterothallicus]
MAKHVPKTLGRVRLQDGTGATLLVPQPSSDPNDPLNWSRAFKIYVAVLTCTALIWVNFYAAGPSTVLIELVINLFGAYPPDPANPATLSPSSIAKFSSAVTKVALLFSITSATAGVANLLWVPLALKYRRRVIYTSSFLAFGVCSSRIIGSWFAGSTECVAPLTITNIFFLHERGKMTAMYSASLSTGAAFGSLITGLLSISQSWRIFYYLSAALVLVTTALIFFTMPETAFQREASSPQTAAAVPKSREPSVCEMEDLPPQPASSMSRKSCLQRLAFNAQPLTQESIWKIAFHPMPLILLPPVLWSTVSVGIGIGIFVVMGTTAATALSQVYHFTVWQVRVVWIASIIGNVLRMPFGGYFSDWVADRATSKNGGIREPEMRLPAVSVAMICYPSSLLLYGLGIHYRAHYMVLIFGLFLFSFGSSAAIGVSVTYTIDSYRAIAGEVIISQVAFKSVITFLMSFYANPWVERDGYAGAFGTMAGFSFFILALWIPLYVWGKRIRHATLKWRIMNLVHWDADRDMGE